MTPKYENENLTVASPSAAYAYGSFMACGVCGSIQVFLAWIDAGVVCPWIGALSLACALASWKDSQCP